MTSETGQARAERQAESRQSTTRTVLIAGVANIIVMLAKLVAGVLTGSSAMLAEAAHSFADTLNQVFLFTSVRQGQRPADEEHPFGYGQERYFWSLLAAFGIFIAGAGFSIFEGILSLHSKTNDFLIAYVVLAVCAIAEGTSFIRAYGQLRGEAHRSHTHTLEHVKTSRDTTVKAALFEDTAAVIGLALAAGGLLLEQITGSPVFDGGASIAIGVLLIVVAFRLGMDSRELLIGRSADPEGAPGDPGGNRADAGRGPAARAADHARGPGQPDRRGPGRAERRLQRRPGGRPGRGHRPPAVRAAAGHPVRVHRSNPDRAGRG